MTTRALKLPKLLCTADVHIYAYFKHSEVNHQGIPSRLSDFERLAEDLAAVAVQHQCDAILIAGDLLQSPVVPPMTINAAKRFMETLAGCLPTICIPGQHDLDVKIDEGTVDHSIITPIAGAAVYHSDPGLHRLALPGKKEITYYAQPWTPTSRTEWVPADVLIGHGMVVGSKDPYGYTFKHGFELDDLYSNFRFSLIGDIHQSQVFRQTKSGHTVLVPGQPLQSNFSSGFPSGVWTVDLAPKGAPALEFLPTHELPHGKQYHYFVQESHSLSAEYPNIHQKIAKEKVKKKDKKAAAQVVALPLHEVVETQLKETQFQDPAWARQEFQKAYESSKKATTGIVPKKSVLLRVIVSDFLSIGSEPVELDLADLSGNSILISGENGAGKSTLAEAIYWGLTGTLTKAVPVAEINCSQTSSPARVELQLTVEEVPYTIVRTRKAGSLLKLYRDGEDITSNDVQTQIYDLLGYQERDLKILMYFSLNSLQLFTNLTPGEQLAVIAGISPVEQLEQVQLALESVKMELSTQYQQLKSEQDYLQQRRGQLETKLTSAQYDTLSGEVDVPATQARVQELEAQEAKLAAKKDSLAARRQAAYEKVAELRELSRREGVVREKISASQRELDGLVAQTRTAKSGNCPTCKQSLVDKTLLQELAAKVGAAQARHQELSNYQFEFNEMVLLDAESQEQQFKTAQEQITQQLSKTRTDLASLKKSLQDAEGAVQSAQRIELLKEELAGLSAQLDPAPVAAVASRLEDLALLQKFFSKNNRNPVYLKLLEGSYYGLLEVVNGLLEAVQYEFRLELTDNFTLKVRDSGGKSCSIGRLSGGERRLLDYAVLLGLSRYYSQVFGTGPVLNLRIFDEVFVYLTAKNMQLAHSLLQELDGINLVISNDEKMKGLFESRVEVTKVNSCSQYSYFLR